MHLRSSGSTLVATRTTYQHLQQHEAKSSTNLQARDEIQISEAFGNQKCPKLVRTLASSADPGVCARACRTLLSILRCPTDVSACLKSGLVPVLERHLAQEQNPVVASLALSALELLSRDTNGKVAILHSGVPERFLHTWLSNAKPSSERTLMYRLCLNCTRMRDHRSMFTQDWQFLPLFIERISAELELFQHRPHSSCDENLCLSLELVQHALEDGRESTLVEAVTLEAVIKCLSVLRSSGDQTGKSPEVLTRVCQTLTRLCFHESARDVVAHTEDKQALFHETLCPLLRHEVPAVVSAAAGWIMLLAVHDPIKHDLVEAGVLAYLPGLLREEAVVSGDGIGGVLNGLKIIAALAQHPKAKARLSKVTMVERLKTLGEHPDALLAKSALTALHAVLWKP